ncbi:MAG: MBL fold metallo-hydrolase [Burkholderiaceae bacterium]
MLRFRCLGSGSEGNALVVEARDGLFATRVLVDNGFSPRQLAARLARAGLTPDDLDAVFVTHEHSDHADGVAALLERRRLPLFATAGTAAAARLDTIGADLRMLRAGVAVEIGALRIEPFAVPHDADEPVQFVFDDGARRFGLLTDVGTPTAAVAGALGRLDALMLECNHDSALLRASDYPPFLKARIAGDRGHLSNAQAAELLARVDRSRLRCVVAAHLSRRNNAPALAQAALAAVLACASAEVLVARQAEGLDWITV